VQDAQNWICKAGVVQRRAVTCEAGAMRLAAYISETPTEGKNWEPVLPIFRRKNNDILLVDMPIILSLCDQISFFVVT
jgi:hypothetical protein